MGLFGDGKLLKAAAVGKHEQKSNAKVLKSSIAGVIKHRQDKKAKEREAYEKEKRRQQQEAADKQFEGNISVVYLSL